MSVRRCLQDEITQLMYLVVPPVGKNLAQILVDSISWPTGWQKKKECDEQAALLFKMFQKYEFTGSHRFGSETNLSDNQKKHREILRKIRHDPNPVDRKLLEKLPKLTEEDTKTPEWRFTPVMVTGNAERQILNEMQIRKYAKFHNLPILSYYVKLSGASNENSITRIAKNIILKKPLRQAVSLQWI